MVEFHNDWLVDGQLVHQNEFIEVKEGDAFIG